MKQLLFEKCCSIFLDYNAFSIIRERDFLNLFQKKLDARSQSQSRRMAIKIHQNKEKSNQRPQSFGRQLEDHLEVSNLSMN
jgi:hypothetical protein